MIETKENLEQELRYHEGMIEVITEKLKNAGKYSRELGSVFRIGDDHFIVARNPYPDSMACDVCCFGSSDVDCYDQYKPTRGECVAKHRTDGEDVFFAKLEIGGDEDVTTEK